MKIDFRVLRPVWNEFPLRDIMRLPDAPAHRRYGKNDVRNIAAVNNSLMTIGGFYEYRNKMPARRI